jgi:hypothetical protein
MISSGVFERQALRVAAVLVAYLAVTGLVAIWPSALLAQLLLIWRARLRRRAAY